MRKTTENLDKISKYVIKIGFYNTDFIFILVIPKITVLKLANFNNTLIQT